MPVRVPITLLVLAAAATCVLVAAGVRPAPAGPASVDPRARISVAAGAVEPAPVAVLEAWDRRRSAAWASGDEAALGRLYTRSSRARAADLALFHRYAARGLLVRGMRMQVLRVRIVVARPRVLRLEVTDRLAGGVVALAGGASRLRRLPADSATTRVVTLRRVGDLWLMARVSAPVVGG